MKVAWVLVGALLFGCGRHHPSSGQVSGTPDAGSGTEVTGGTGGGSRGTGGSPGGGDLDASADVAVDASPFPAFDVAGPDAAPAPDLAVVIDAPGPDGRPDATDGPVAGDSASGPDAPPPPTPEFHLTLPLSSSVVTTHTPTIGWT